ncbi:MAG: 50S ribosomal protein L32e [Ignisphaera sp.]
MLLKMRMRKPEFLRWLWWKFAKFENNLKWKRPRGKDNPVRLALKGYPPKASIGYGTPNEIKDLHPSGLKPVVVANVADLNKLDPSKHIVYIASSVGLKKRLELVKLAKSKGLKVANER